MHAFITFHTGTLCTTKPNIWGQKKFFHELKECMTLHYSSFRSAVFLKICRGCVATCSCSASSSSFRRRHALTNVSLQICNRTVKRIKEMKFIYKMTGTSLLHCVEKWKNVFQKLSHCFSLKDGSTVSVVYKNFWNYEIYI